MVFFFALLFGVQTPAVYARPELLVDTAWLAQHAGDVDVRVIDIRGRGYAESHVPGAVFVDSNWIRNPKAPPTFLPTPEEFEALMSGLGIGDNTKVVVYDERGGIFAARLWWILNYYGHSNVALVDGGWVKWTAEQRPTDAAAPTVAPRAFKVKTGTVKVATADQVKAAINTPGMKLIDARTQGEIDGNAARMGRSASGISQKIRIGLGVP